MISIDSLKGKSPACIRRGPFAIPDDTEMVEYLLSRKRIIRAPAEQHGVYHVLSYQRRLNALKNEFFARHDVTPLGRLMDWWDSLLVLLS